MTTEEYQKLNEYLNDIFIYLEKRDRALLDNIYPISILNDSFCNFIHQYDLRDDRLENKLTFQDIYLLAREIIGSIHQEYLEDYNQLITSGELDFSYDREYFDSYFTHLEDHNNIHNLININRHFNYRDVVDLVHEFMHYESGKNKTSTNHYLLTEFLSIFFENYAIDYLINQEKNPKYMNYNHRLISTKFRSKRLGRYEIVLLAYEKFGSIDEHTIEYLNPYFLKINKENFDRECKGLLKIIENLEQWYKTEFIGIKESDKKKIRCRLIEEVITEDYRYIFSTLFALYARKFCNIENIVYLNNHINDSSYQHKSIYEILSSIGINCRGKNFTDELFTSIEEYINGSHHNSKKLCYNHLMKKV